MLVYVGIFPGKASRALIGFSKELVTKPLTHPKTQMTTIKMVKSNSTKGNNYLAIEDIIV